MARPRHTNKHIEAAVKYAERHGWRWMHSDGHPWGRMLCPHEDRSGCDFTVYSTPQHPEAHARRLMRKVDDCPAKHPVRREKKDERKNEGKDKGKPGSKRRP
jgi:hypothetical protein